MSPQIGGTYAIIERGGKVIILPIEHTKREEYEQYKEYEPAFIFPIIKEMIAECLSSYSEQGGEQGN